MVDLKELGKAATGAGWRQAAADRVAPRLAGRTRAREDQIRAALGLVLLALSIKYVIGTARRYRRDAA